MNRRVFAALKRVLALAIWRGVSAANRSTPDRSGWVGEIIATKYTVKVGSSNPLYWAWLDMNGNPVDSSGDQQMLTIRDCESGTVLIDPVGDPGASGFRYKEDNWWQYNWDSMGEAGRSYCASVESGRTGQIQFSRPIRLR